MNSATLFTLNAVLALMMFGIALSLTTADFRRIAKQPVGPMVGMAAQFILLPALTCLLVWLIPMPSEIALGLLLVSCCPGGSFSNLMTYLSGGNTALSVSMTGIASLLACLLTPINFMFYAAINPRTHALLSDISVSVTDMPRGSFGDYAGIDIQSAMTAWLDQTFAEYPDGLPPAGLHPGNRVRLRRPWSGCLHPSYRWRARPLPGP